MGKPATLIVAKNFQHNAIFNARSEGLSDISVTVLPVGIIPLPDEIKDSGLAEEVAEGVIAALTRRTPAQDRTEAPAGPCQDTIEFSGDDYSEAVESMEKHFLQSCWSDGFPLVPPTQAAVSKMLEGTQFPPGHVVALVEPGGGQATMEKIAVNAVMAGCLPQYMPVLIAALQAITDPVFDLRGVQCTTGFVSPLLIISGPRLIGELNINDSFSTVGPGWRANATIGRALRLIMINIGYGWPGKNDMKAFGNPLKYVTLMAENEAGYAGAWEPLRVAEGFDYTQPTVSVMPAVSWQPNNICADLLTLEKLFVEIARQGKAKYDRFAANWGSENLVLIDPDAFVPIRRKGLSRIEVQKALYELIQLPCPEFFEGRPPSANVGTFVKPEWLVARCRDNPDALEPLLPDPKSIKIVVAGGSGEAMITYVGAWGYGSHFVTKPVALPSNWESLLQKCRGWETPIIR